MKIKTTIGIKQKNLQNKYNSFEYFDNCLEGETKTLSKKR